MAMAVDLSDAANLTYQQLALKWTANTLDTACASFSAAASALLSDGLAGDRTVGNWLIPIDGVIADMPVGVVPVELFSTVVSYIYKMCWQAFSVNALTPPLISNVQAAALLAAWNAAFGT